MNRRQTLFRPILRKICRCPDEHDVQAPVEKQLMWPGAMMAPVKVSPRSKGQGSTVTARTQTNFHCFSKAPWVQVLLMTLFIAQCPLLMTYLPAQTLDAHAIMSSTEAALQQGGGVDASFTLASSEGSAKGTIHLQGASFVVETSGMKTWFNGHDQWTYLVRANEVTISTPTAEELQTLNPYAWLGLYRTGGYDLQAETCTTTPQGTTGYRVVLTATSRQALWPRIAVTLTRAYRLTSVVLIPSGHLGDESLTTTITVTSYRDGLSYPASHFQPTQADYPDAEFIDLR